MVNRFYRALALGVIVLGLHRTVTAETFETWLVTGGDGIVQIGVSQAHLTLTQSSLEALSVDHVFRAFTAGSATFAGGSAGASPSHGGSAGASPSQGGKSAAYELHATAQTELLLHTASGTYMLAAWDVAFDASSGQFVIDDAQLVQSGADGDLIVGSLSLRLSAVVVNVQISNDPQPITYDGDFPEICPNPNTGPDVIVGALPSVVNFGTDGSGIYAYAAATTSCNIGNQTLNWIQNTNQHPVIAENLYRLKTVNGAGQFEQIGMSWLKHGFGALAGSLCCPCTNPGTFSLLGVGCSDPYTASTNGDQPSMGPRSQVNAATGCFPYPFSNPSPSACGGGNNYLTPPAPPAVVGRRLQVAFADIDAAPNAGALYFIEAHYLAPDDTAAGNDNNNASYRRVMFSGTSMSLVSGFITQQQKAGIRAWQDNDPAVTLVDIDVPNDGAPNGGRMTLGYRVTDLGAGQKHYEYALYNMNSNRSAQSFSIPVPAGVVITNVGFHDVSYHSGELYSSTDWTGGALDGDITWSTQTYAQNVNANALRWGTLYNFRFDANTEPQAASATIGLFKPGTPTSVTVATVGPSLSVGLANIVSANPPTPAGNPYAPGAPFRDVLDTGTGPTLTAGIGGATTESQGGINYAQISVTFNATPSPAPTPANITLSCTAGPCPTVTGVSGSGFGPYDLTLSGVIPPLQCTTITFAGTNAGQKLQYTSVPGDVDLDAAASTVDLLWLVQRINDGTANLPENLARYNIDRSTGVGPQVNTLDVLRLVQLLNGTNTTQAFNGITVAACP